MTYSFFYAYRIKVSNNKKNINYRSLDLSIVEMFIESI